MRRILILANNDIGLYKFRKELIEELLKDNEVFISLPNGEFVNELVNIGCKFIDTKISRRGTNPFVDLILMINYIKIIKRIKPDIVLTYTIKPNIYGGIACIFSKTTYIANITGLGTAVENGGLMQRFTTLLYRIALKKVRCVFFQNTENKQYFIDRNIAIGKHKLLPGSGVNLEHFHLLEYPSTESIEFVFISRIMKQKGIDQYLEAARYIKERYHNTIFHICGFCEEEYEDILGKMQADGIVEYHGMIKDIRDILKRVHCTIHPTYYPEGLSNVLLESASCGRPLIATNRAGCREVVDDGINGYIVKQKDSQDLIEKIEKFISLSYDEKINMGLKSRKKVEKEFDRHIVINEYLMEIQKI